MYSPMNHEDESMSQGSSPRGSVLSLHPSTDSTYFVSGAGPRRESRNEANLFNGSRKFREFHGRVLNNQNETYMLPADPEEHQRLDIQHNLYRAMLGGLYPAPDLVRRALAPRNGPNPQILDVGTGSGTWAIEMALEFPHCEVVGIDLTPPHISVSLPGNCRFELDDANLGFPHFENTFDVVHARAVSGGIHDFPHFLNELASTLRPGGIMLLAGGDLQLFDNNKQPMPLCQPGDPRFSWAYQLFFAAYNAMKSRGGSIDAPALTPRWLEDIPTLKERSSGQIFLPIGPWPKGLSRREQEMAEVLLINTVSHMSGMAPLLVNDGYPADAVEDMIQQACAEVREQRVHLYTRWHFAWAVKANMESATAQ